jgi:hypothetical protein
MCGGGHGKETTHGKSANQGHFHRKLLVRRLRVFQGYLR